MTRTRIITMLLMAIWAGRLSQATNAQELPEDELQVNVDGYFDNFRVNVVYPSVALTKQVSETTSLTARYLVDVISAASIKSKFDVDGVTSATSRREGGGEGLFDEVRHEAGLGVTQLLGPTTLSVNGLYSTEHDYTSRTLATRLAVPFAKRNTTVSLGLVRSWDTVAPQTRSWTASKDVVSVSVGLTQLLGKRLLVQLDGTYTHNKGMLSDPYQVITILNAEAVTTFEPIHPDTRLRKAIGGRISYKISPPASLQLGYRYYWDDWEVRSHTVSGLYQHRLGTQGPVLGLGVRGYQQTAAFFFEETYPVPAPLMTVDSKLDEAYSVELQGKVTFEGESLGQFPFFGTFFPEHTALTLRLNTYFRHTHTADWHSRRRTLQAYVLGIGYRFKF